ncbi:MAG TPA: 3-deoxy-7-phosphoheptulonate synthase [Gemmatimonadales bacterium]|nr:3-deoxy-7-phosphoheptulonate synthase [Gemmatimonadales bacterium]
MTVATSCEPVSRTLREQHPDDSVVRVAGVPVGGRRFTVIAGPCAVESAAQLGASAAAAAAHGAHLLRGGAFKPRTSPYAFQGHGLAALRLLRDASRRTGLPVVSEILEARDVEAMAPYVDAFQVGARNMQSSPLLRALGRQPKPVLLKRGLAATVDELLHAAEYLVAGGNDAVILCERGIRTFETATRNTLDLNAVAYLKRRTHLPVLVDPSHGTGRRELVAPLACAAAAVGADGIMVEVHPDPDAALSDGPQSLAPDDFARLMARLAPFVAAAGRTLT